MYSVPFCLGTRCTNYFHEINVPCQCSVSSSLSDTHINGYFHLKEKVGLFPIQDYNPISFPLMPLSPFPPPLLSADDILYFRKLKLLDRAPSFPSFILLQCKLYAVFYQRCSGSASKDSAPAIVLHHFFLLQWKVKVKSPRRVRLFATPWTVAHQAPPSIGFSRQEYWSGLPFPSPGDLAHSGIEPGSPAL